jgi:type VI secretion system secreted protein VgrG
MSLSLDSGGQATRGLQTLVGAAKDPFQIQAGPFSAGALRVLSVAGHESVNDVYAYEVTVATEEAPERVATDPFGEPAYLALNTPGHPARVVHGLVTAVEALGGVPGDQGGKRRHFRLEIAPKLALLQRRRQRRIFQNKSAVEILKVLFDAVDMRDTEYRWRIPESDLPKLPFVYQRDETDYELFRRILASAGVFFYFEHANGSLDEVAGKPCSILNFGYNATHTPAVKPAKAGSSGGEEDPSDTIRFDDGILTASDEDRIYAFALKKAVRSKSLRLLDRDPQAATNWGAATVSPDAGNAAAFDADAKNIKAEELRQQLYEVDVTVWADGVPKPSDPTNKRMALELERIRLGYLEAAGTSDCRRMGAGYRFGVAGHPIKALEGEYIVTRLEVEGVHPDFASEAHPVYRNTFRCVPSAVAPRPKRPELRPQAAMEIATVVRAVGGEKFPGLEANACNYVHVRFHWDVLDDFTPRGGLEMNDEDRNAIWIPVMQPWAGEGYGAQFVPREGMEVLVGFFEGQSERPVILGCLHSEKSPPPWHDEVGNQKVGIRSQSRPVNGGYSEISIDDRAGHENLYIQAQKTQTTLVKAGQSISVGGSRSVSVGASETITVGAARTTTVGAAETRTFKDVRVTTVTKTDDLTVDQKHTGTFHGGREVKVDGADDNLTVNGVKMNTTVHGEYNVVADTHFKVTQKGTSLLLEDKCDVTSDGPVTVSNGKCKVELKDGNMTLTGADQIGLVCGNASITLKKDGTIEVGGQTKVSLSGGQASLELAPAGATVSGPKVTVSGAGSTEITGAVVKIN